MVWFWIIVFAITFLGAVCDKNDKVKDICACIAVIALLTLSVITVI